METALHVGGLDWTVSKIPLMTAEDPPTITSRRMAVVRDDRDPSSEGRVLGVVHRDSHPLQNRVGLEMFDRLLGQVVKYHTGGYLGNGERIWLLARIPTEMKISPKDMVEPYVLFSNSHDGTLAVDVRLTTVRVVCQNTLNLALSKDKVGRAFKRRHDGKWDILEKDLKGFLDGWIDDANKYNDLFTVLNEKPCDDGAFEELVAKLAFLQHHGIPTRLIDFTRNPWVALFFASESMDRVDGRLFAIMVDQASVHTVTPNGTPWRTYSTSDIVMWDPTASGVSFPRVAAQDGVLAVGRLPSTQPYRSCIDELTNQRRAMLAEDVRRILSIPFRLTGTASSLPPRASPPIGITIRVHVDKESIRRDLVPRSAGRRISPSNMTINHRFVYPDAAGMAAYSPLLQGLEKGILIP